MVAGGAEELHFSHAGVFDIMYATSRAFNDAPERSPRPFDKNRDGLVVGEGAGTFVLEEWERAKRAGKNIYAEVVGFGTNCDGTHVDEPVVRRHARARWSSRSRDARLDPDDDRLRQRARDRRPWSATSPRATPRTRCSATRRPVSSLKGHLGHTLGACGAIEAALSIAMMRDGFIAPTRNLEELDPRVRAARLRDAAPRATPSSTSS